MGVHVGEMDKLAAVVILYNPDKNVVNNIKSYIHYIDILYVVLNTEVNIDIYNYLYNEEKIRIIKHRENEGIAKSLNEVLCLVKNNYSWLLTMDQDSSFISNSVNKYLAIIGELDAKEIYGVTSKITCNDIISSGENFDYIDRCITSGMILNVKIAVECGGFCEDLFIDEVDYEFCYRVNERGFKLIRYPYKVMKHYIGNEKICSVAGVKFSTENERYFRLFYIYRNCLYVMSKYKHTRKKYIIALLKRTIKIIIAEDDKMRKIKYAFKGIKAFLFNQMGKLKKWD